MKGNSQSQSDKKEDENKEDEKSVVDLCSSTSGKLLGTTLFS